VEESFWIGNAEVKIVRVKGDQVKIGITAPKSVKVWREEIRPNDQYRIPKHHFNGNEPLEY